MTMRKIIEPCVKGDFKRGGHYGQNVLSQYLTLKKNNEREIGRKGLALLKKRMWSVFEGFDLATIPTVFVSNRRNRGRGRK
jgi:hypothetical protein